jgi:hypothetical protein
VLDEVRRLVADGRAAFEPGDVGTLLADAARMVDLLSHGDCRGFLGRGGRR